MESISQPAGSTVGKACYSNTHEMLIDMAKGKHLVSPSYAGAESLIAINYNGPQNGANALGWWPRLAIPTHQDQPGFWRAINAQPLNGIGTAGGLQKT